MGFGSDFSGVDDLDPTLAFLTGDADERVALAQAIARRLSTPRGGLFYDPAYGYDLRQLISSTSDPTTEEQKIEDECTKDERVKSATVSITVIGHGPQKTWQIEIECTTNDGTKFVFTLSVSSVTVQLLTVGQ